MKKERRFLQRKQVLTILDRRKMKLFYRENLLPKELKTGLNALSDVYPISQKGSKNNVEVKFKPGGNRLKQGLKVTYNKEGVEIIYGRRIDAFRALGRLMGANQKKNFAETPGFDFLGLMIDCSRGAVLNLKSAKKWLRHLALMGINGLTLYTEDTYQIKDEPFFGYLRGAYSKQELKELDNYANMFGIEIFPCIQTLGHMGQVLRWPVYQNIMDVEKVLLVDEEKTYLLLEKMIKAASAPFRSQRIHIGMDETYGLGTGVYQQKHGSQSSFDIFNKHLKRVCQICSQMKLKPMIWNDMYFRFGSKTNNYYDKNSVIPQKIIDTIPRNVDLVYWDYYHTDERFYIDFLDKHKIFGKPPIVAPGLWTWGRLWTSHRYAKATLGPCMATCKKKGVREILATMWGDDGSECNFFSALPAVQLYAEHCYQGKINPLLLKANFQGSCQANFDAYVRACDLDNIPGVADSSKSPYNPSKILLWDDPLLGLWEKDLPVDKLASHYRKLKIELKNIIKKDADGTKPLKFACQLAQTLQLKSNLWSRMVAAYKSKKDLSRFIKKEIPALSREVKKLYKMHRTSWMENNKPFGFEVIESRYATLLARLDSLKTCLNNYLSKKIDSIEEWEIPHKRIGPSGKFPVPTNYKNIVFPSAEVFH